MKCGECGAESGMIKGEINTYDLAGEIQNLCDECMEEKPNAGFNYVDVVGEGCEGWINLFHGSDIVCCVMCVPIADEIKKTTPMRNDGVYQTVRQLVES